MQPLPVSDGAATRGEEQPSFAARLFVAEGRLRPVWRLMLFVPLASVCMALGATLGALFTSEEAATEIGGTAGLLAASLLMTRFADRRPLRSLGLVLRPGRLPDRDFLLGCLIAFAQLGLLLSIEVACGWTRIVSLHWDGRVLLGGVGLFLGVAFLEEMLSRGYLFQTLEALCGGWKSGRRGAPSSGAIIALALTSIGFGLMHAGNPNASAPAVVLLVLAGVELGVAYLVTRRLWLPIGLHFAWNLAEGTVFGFPVSGQEVASLLQLERSGPLLWTGGAFGPEAGVFAIPVSLGNIALMLWLARRGFWQPELWAPALLKPAVTTSAATAAAFENTLPPAIETQPAIATQPTTAIAETATPATMPQITAPSQIPTPSETSLAGKARW